MEVHHAPISTRVRLLIFILSDTLNSFSLAQQPIRGNFNFRRIQPSGRLEVQRAPMVQCPRRESLKRTERPIGSELLRTTKDMLAQIVAR